MDPSAVPESREIEIPIAGGQLRGTLAVPPEAAGLVLFVHAGGGDRTSPRNRSLAARLHAAGLATFVFDLLTEREEAIDRYTAFFRFDVAMLTRRLVAASDWMAREPEVRDLPVGYLGTGTGSAAALAAAAQRPQRIGAVVSRVGRPDLAGEALPLVVAPTLLIVGGEDETLLDLNRRARAAMASPVELEVIGGASHRIDEAGAGERAADLVAGWLRWRLGASPELPAGGPPHDPIEVGEPAYA